MKPSSREIRSQETAQLLLYVHNHLNTQAEKYVRDAAKDTYGNVARLDDMVVELCALLTAMHDTDRDALVYNAKDKTARRLADWWEEHLEADRKRIAQEQKAAKAKTVVETAKGKLTNAELNVLKKAIQNGEL
jgi:predicted DNA binding protein